MARVKLLYIIQDHITFNDLCRYLSEFHGNLSIGTLLLSVSLERNRKAFATTSHANQPGVNYYAAKGRLLVKVTTWQGC